MLEERGPVKESRDGIFRVEGRIQETSKSAQGLGRGKAGAHGWSFTRCKI